MTVQGILITAMMALAMTFCMFNTPQSDAFIGPFPNPNPGTTSALADPGTVPYDGVTIITVCTDETPRDIVPTSLVSPTGVNYAGNPTVAHLDANSCVNFLTGGAFTDYPGVSGLAETGNWVAFFEDTLNGNEFVVDFGVSFFVIPESPIGSIAMMAASLAALGTFVYFRQYRNRAIV